MTITSQIITDAFRQSNLLAIGVEPTELQSTEALRFLNRIVKSVFGNEAGDAFTSFPIGNSNIERPSGYPWWDTTPNNDWFVPLNTRLVFNLNSDITDGIYLHPNPEDGSRFAAVDSADTMATYPVTIYGNGRQIETSQSIVLNTNGVDKEWFYRADLANWMLYAPLVADTLFPFPEEFDDFFISMLSLRLNPSYGAQLDPQSQLVLSRSKTQFRARYSQVIAVRSELALIRPARVAGDRNYWDAYDSYSNPDALFGRGSMW